MCASGGSDDKESTCNARDSGLIPGLGRSPGEGDSYSSEHSSVRAWRIPWTEEPGGLQFMGLQRVGHNSVTNTSASIHIKLAVLHVHHVLACHSFYSQFFVLLILPDLI